MRRLGIFLFYDGKGRVSPHVHTSIKAFAPHLDDLIFVANGALDMSTYDGLQDYVTHLLKRENVGFDVWGYKAGLEYVGYENLTDYDEIILLNYTFFAPVSDLSVMFDRMDMRAELDGWGMTEYSDTGKTFLQSYFLCSRRSLHASQDYQDYWKNMPMIESINDSLDYHEFRFSRYFRDLGYNLAPYVVNRDHWDGNTTLTDNQGLIDDGMPIIKYRSFNFDPEIVEARGGRKVAQNFDIVRNETDYPVSEIWDYIIDQTAPDDLINATESCKVVTTEITNYPLPGAQVIATLSDPSTLNLAMERLQRFPSEHVVVATDHVDIRSAALERGFFVQETDTLHFALRSAQKHLGEAANKGLVVIHLSDFPEERDRYFFKDTLFQNYWDPLLSAEAITWLKQEDHLGMVFSFPDSVSGVTSYRNGTGSSLGNWKKDFRPECLRRAAAQKYWPWRGNILIKASVVTSEHFQETFSTLLDNIVIRENESLAGPEGALPELIRELGFASGIVVPQTEAGKLLLRSAARSKASTRKITELTQKFRRDLRQIQNTPGTSGKSRPTKSTGNPISGSSKLTRHGLPGRRYYLLDSRNGQQRLEDVLQLRHTFESWDVLGNGLQTTGWAFDTKHPFDFIHVGILHGDDFIWGPNQLTENRPDVLDAFKDLPLVERSGFDLNLPEIKAEERGNYRIVFINSSQNTLCVMPFRKDKAPISMRLLAQRAVTHLMK